MHSKQQILHYIIGVCFLSDLLPFPEKELVRSTSTVGSAAVLTCETPDSFPASLSFVSWTQEQVDAYDVIDIDESPRISLDYDGRQSRM